MEGEPRKSHLKWVGIVMAGVAVLMAVASTSCEPVTDAGVRYVAIAEDGTVVATVAEYIIGSLESMQSATTSDGGRTWTNADKTYRKAGNESVQIPRGIYAIQSARVDLVSEDRVDSGLAPDLSCGAGDTLVVEGAG